MLLRIVTVVAATLAACGRLHAADGSGITPLPWLPGLAVFAGLMALQHILAPRVRAALKGQETIVTSFGGGMAVTYVFIFLLPELDKANRLLGPMVFLVTLVAFLIHYTFGEYLFHRRQERQDDSADRHAYRVKLFQSSLYNWLIVYSIPEDFAEFGLRACAIAAAMLLHAGHGDFFFGREYPEWFDGRGRFFLALAPLLGWAAAVAPTKNDAAINDIFIALLAGTLLYAVFTEELPNRGTTRFRWFLAGVAVFTLLGLIVVS